MKSDDEKLKSTGYLVIVAFYYLLQVSEYTKSQMVQRNGQRICATHTKQFSVENVGSFKAGQIVP